MHLLWFQITFTARAAGKAAQLGMGEDRLISYLPLSHIAAQIMDVYASIHFAVAIYFAQPDALRVSIFIHITYSHQCLTLSMKLQVPNGLATNENLGVHSEMCESPKFT